MTGAGAYRLRVIGLASGRPTPYAGQYVKAYDPNAGGGRGTVTFTPNWLSAMTFATKQDAWRCWQQTSAVAPVRPDGKPNRPLSAFTVQVIAD